MNRNRKHPGKAPYRRHANTGDRTRNSSRYRITGTWPARPTRPAVTVTPDRKAVRRIAREMAEQGARVTVEKHAEHGNWQTLYEVDGPALLAERHQAEQRKREAVLAAAREQRLADEYAAQLAQNEAAREQNAERELAAVARLMMRPPVAREACGRATVRHVSGPRQ
ncbi:hypothetical protein [Streptomyces sp. BA2]|uniref:hypothetical protein n=1 Tax=Streptomyces sp. BA2 TaxID=436595 RepID=UPI001321F656|nr:hypothetical protein [Streptomyces sp. BA2]MWA12586.1 hypothetical protein [Streptomyces sp. BA2]